MVYTGHKPLEQVAASPTKTFLQGKNSVYASTLCALLLSIGYCLFFHREEKVFFDSHHPVKTTFYSDAVDNGQSKVLKTWESGNVIGMDCLLKEGFPFPYSGFELSRPDDAFWDLSDYNRMEVEVSTRHLDHLYVYLTLQDKDVKNTANRLALRRLVSDLKTDAGGTQSVHLPMDQFVTPDWWYGIVNQPKTDFSQPNLTKVKSVIFSTGLNPLLHEPSGISVHRVRFYRDNTWVLLGMLGVQGLVMLGLYTIHSANKKEPQVPKTPVYVTYKAIEVKEAPKTKTGYRFLDYIHENYTNPELGLMEISKQMGISHRSISDTISEKFGCNIKTYINQIRIHESKRLLEKSDLKVSEIAYQVGFNSPVNFNRVFKSFTGISPTEYLQQKDKIA